MTEVFKPQQDYIGNSHFLIGREKLFYGDISPHEFMENLVKDFNIKTVNYPGSARDFTLDRVFPESGVVYSDDSQKWRDVFLETEAKGNFVRAGEDNPPFKDNSFDALYLQDLHFTGEQLNKHIRTVKAGGLIIFSMDDCENGDKDDLAKVYQHDQLELLELPYRVNMFYVFQKICLQNPHELIHTPQSLPQT